MTIWSGRPSSLTPLYVLTAFMAESSVARVTSAVPLDLPLGP